MITAILVLALAGAAGAALGAAHAAAATKKGYAA